ncbi:response regulator transcription factor [Bdellovibrionota bacterium FG-2]
MARIRLLIVDDHRLVREGLKAALKDYLDIEIVGEASDGITAFEQVRDLTPNVVLMDISMPRMNGVDSTKKILSHFSKTKVIILTMHDDLHLIRQLRREGVSGFFQKAESSPEELVVAIRGVCPRKRIPLSLDAPRELTPRELQVLTLVARGLSSKAIACELCISVRTVTTHRERVMQKLGIHNTAGLTRYVMSSSLFIHSKNT